MAAREERSKVPSEADVVICLWEQCMLGSGFQGSTDGDAEEEGKNNTS